MERERTWSWMEEVAEISWKFIEDLCSFRVGSRGLLVQTSHLPGLAWVTALSIMRMYQVCSNFVRYIHEGRKALDIGISINARISQLHFQTKYPWSATLFRICSNPGKAYHQQYDQFVFLSPISSNPVEPHLSMLHCVERSQHHLVGLKGK